MVENIVFLILSGLVLRFSLSITGQNWVKTYQQTIEPKKEDFFKDCKL